MAGPLPEVRVRARGTSRILSLHPWVFASDVAEVGSAANGDLVRVLSDEGRVLGYASYSSRSKITLRILSLGREPPGRAFWASRVDDALRHRERVVRDTDACRIIFGESDGIPGLVVDRYGTHLVVQTLTAAAERWLSVVLDLLEERITVESVLARNDPSVRTLEGLSREIVQLRGKTPERIETEEGPVRCWVDPWKGQKTGAFLDQRENRMAAAAYCSGRVLDVFCFQGAFALHAALRADEVVAVDSSAEALSLGCAGAERNHLANIRFTEANAFDDLRARHHRGEAFDVVFLDPPAFAKSRADVPAARRGYKEINLRAMHLLRSGGILVTSSCSYNLGEAEWIEVLTSAAADVRRTFRVLDKRTQARDHPLRLGFPESHYLKCLVLSLM